MALSEAAKRAQKKYNEKTITIAASYKPGTDLKEGERVKAYLNQTGQSANSYIKALIKRDLDCKGVMMGNVGKESDHRDCAECGNSMEDEKIENVVADDNKLPLEE